MTSRPNARLRLLLAFVDRLSRLVPAPRRRAWRRQWRADLAYASQRDGARHGLKTVPYMAGAARHAFWLRGHVRRMEMISQDLRYGWRLMVRRPAFTIVAVLTLGLGIGANVTIYSWIEALLLRPLPGVADIDRLVALNGTTPTRSDLSTSWPNFVDMRSSRPASVDDMLASRVVAVSVRTTGEPERVWGEIVSANYFDVLGVRPALGRAFLPDDDRAPDASAVVVFSYAYWRNHLGGDPAAVGRIVTINGRAFTVIGIAPKGFHGNAAALAFDAWIPMMMQTTVMPGDRLHERGNNWLAVMLKLKPGASLARAQADLDVVARDLASAHREDAGEGVRLYPLWRAPGMAGALMLPVLAILMGVVAAVLLIACANVANLLLARAAGRTRETAIRLALGASRPRLLRQLLTESLLLAAAGGTVGAVAAYWTAGLLAAFFPPTRLPLAIDASLSPRVLGFAILMTLGSAVLFGLAPALQGSSSGLVTALKETAGAVTSSPRRTWLRRALVVAQVALSLVLLVSAGLFLQTLRNAQALDPGFSLRNGLLASIDLMPAGYDAASGTAFFRNLLARVRETPGVEAATLTSNFPLGLGSSSDFNATVDGYSAAPNEELTVYYTRVATEYLRTMGIRLVAGRDISDRDTADRPLVGIINETMARRYWRDRNPIGGRIHVGRLTIEVVGVAADGKYGSITEQPRNYLYLPVQQRYRPDATLVVRTAGDPIGALPAIRREVHDLNPNLPLFDVDTVDTQLEASLFLQRLAASLLGGFGAVALMLATIGLYGVVAAATAQRTPEIGMRMALGATRRDILALVLKEGLGVTSVGLALGLAGAAAVTRLFQAQLVGVSARDAGSFAAMSALLAAVALAASYLPARRAASIDPMSALRQE
ncbi:MAG: ABC transporter permease [Betaproteobacteria bacterium]